MSGFKPYLACSASAGSGKTWQLSIRYLSLLFQGVPSEEILCLTFTKKATLEMLERITKLLINIDQDSYKNEREELKKLLLIDDQELQARINKTQKRFLESNHKIMTIDAFFNQILRSFALNVGISPLFDVAKSSQTEEIELFLQEIKAQKLSNELLYFAMVLRRDIYGIFDYLHKIYSTKIDLNRFVFDQPKLSDIYSAKDDAFGEYLHIKSIIESSQNASAAAIKSVRFDDLDSVVNQTWFSKETLADFNYFKKIFTPQLDEHFLALKTKCKKWFDLQEKFAISTLVAIYNTYEKSITDHKKKIKKLDFVDITHLAFKLLTQKIDREFFYFKLDSKIKHILIDEFQDTSIVQFNILSPLIEEIVSGFGTDSKNSVKSFFYVGDEKQSIYRFRGGNPYLFDAVKNIYTNIESEVLDTNYRSFRNPVDFVNKIFADHYRDFAPQIPHKSSDGFVSIDESENIIESVVVAVEKLIKSSVSPNDIAILSFKNRDIAVVADEIKSRLNIPVVTETSQKIINLPEIMSIIELVKYIYFKNPLYKANFCALNMLDVDTTDLDYLFDSISAKPYDILFKIIDDFSLYDETSSDMLRFLEYSLVFDTIEEFIFGYKDISLEREKSQKFGITAMTIHKSKGLEFDHAIVFDRIGKNSPDYDKLVFDYEGVNLNSIVYKFKNREVVDSDYRKVLERAEEEKNRDELNALYVAFTRAKESLFVIKKPSSSSFEKLALTPTNIGSFPIGKVDLEKEPTKYIANSVKEEHFGRQTEIIKELSFAPKDIDAINTGLAVHYAIEVLGEFDRNNLRFAIEATSNHFANLVDMQIVRNKLEMLIENDQFMALISGAKVYKELPFRLNKELIRVDMLLAKNDELIVVDFKTGQFASDHQKQVSKYIEKISKISSKKICGYIVYMQENIVIKEVSNAL